MGELRVFDHLNPVSLVQPEQPLILSIKEESHDRLIGDVVQERNNNGPELPRGAAYSPLHVKVRQGPGEKHPVCVIGEIGHGFIQADPLFEHPSVRHYSLPSRLIEGYS